MLTKKTNWAVVKAKNQSSNCQSVALNENYAPPTSVPEAPEALGPEFKSVLGEAVFLRIHLKTQPDHNCSVCPTLPIL